VVHVAAIQFPDPSVTVKYDSDEDQAEMDRKRIFSDAAKAGYWIGAAHISFPGLGHIGMRNSALALARSTAARRQAKSQAGRDHAQLDLRAVGVDRDAQTAVALFHALSSAAR
jgi:hypothetical protein